MGSGFVYRNTMLLLRVCFFTPCNMVMNQRLIGR